MKLIEQIKLGYDNVRYYVWTDGVQIVAQGWMHDSDFAVIERNHRQTPSLRIFCNGVDITDAI